MSKVLVTESYLSDIADSIRTKKGTTATFTPAQMSGAIDTIETPNLQAKTVSPSTSAQTVSPDTGYNGLSSVTVNAISPTKAAQTYTPGTANQTIAAGRWLTGAQTIKGDANLVAENIKKDVSIFGVTGTYEGSGGGGSVPFVTGSFTTGAGGVETINIPYTGNGYIISLSIVIDGGYSSAEYRQYNAVVLTLTKEEPEMAPVYGSSTAVSNRALWTILSRSGETSSARTANNGAKYNSAASPNEGNTNAGVLYISSKNTLAIYTSSATGSTHRGFYPNQKYNYWITYSE